jgi:hypothetical protein
VARCLFMYELKSAHGGKTVLDHEVNKNRQQAGSEQRASNIEGWKLNSSDYVLEQN